LTSGGFKYSVSCYALALHHVAVVVMHGIWLLLLWPPNPLPNDCLLWFWRLK
jgi:hypothetical protein